MEMNYLLSDVGCVSVFNGSFIWCYVIKLVVLIFGWKKMVRSWKFNGLYDRWFCW